MVPSLSSQLDLRVDMSRVTFSHSWRGDRGGGGQGGQRRG